MCQKLWKLAGSRLSYCKNYLAYFFGAHPVTDNIHTEPPTTRHISQVLVGIMAEIKLVQVVQVVKS